MHITNIFVRVDSQENSCSVQWNYNHPILHPTLSCHPGSKVLYSGGQLNASSKRYQRNVTNQLAGIQKKNAYTNSPYLTPSQSGLEYGIWQGRLL